MSGMRPKLLFFVTEDWYFCSHRLPLAVAAAKEGFEVVVITRVREHGDVIRHAGLRLISFEMSRRGWHLFRELAAVARLVGIYRRERPDIVHHVAMKPILYGSLAARLSGVPQVLNAFAGMGWVFTSISRNARLLRSLVSTAMRVLLVSTDAIVQNQDDAALIARWGVRGIHLIRGSGVDTDLFVPTPEPEGPPLVLLPARMLWDKGVGEFVEMAGRLKAVGSEARFVLVGAPDPENPAAVPMAQLIEWQQQNLIEWWGARDDMPAVYAQAHIVCLPSYREGLPKVLLEAAACGRAIVTTDTTGCRDAVANGDTGLLVPVKDAAALADAVHRLIREPETRRRMGALGRRRVIEHFSDGKIVAATLKLYRKSAVPDLPAGKCEGQN